MTHEILFAGFGGQGVMLLGQLVAYAAMNEGKQVSWFPAYGPEMRGGTANSAVVVSDQPVGSPVISEPTVLVAMNRPSLERFLPGVQPGGLVVFNSSLIDLKPDRKDVTIIPVPANEIAVGLGEVRIANMVALGVVLGCTNLVPLEGILKALAKSLPKHRQNLLPLNRQALERGIALAAQYEA